MSQNWQQPGQPPQQPQPGYGYPQQPTAPQPQYGAPQPQYGGGFPPPPPPAGRQGNAGLAIGAAVVAALVGGLLYAFLLSAFADTDGKAEPEITQFAYAGVLVGALVGAAVGKFGGRNTGLWVVGAVLAFVGVFIGELFGYAMILSDFLGNFETQLGAAGKEVPSSTEIFFEHFNSPVFGGPGDEGLFHLWKEDADAITWIFMALAPVASFGAAKKLAG
ncbi:hypothetical protein LRS74_13135 [Streptomyces sp. LX-29]|uniref:hypothetical protein n=1 Tax=Streptomyces sp. LX-29 TaxID=2900152 RepID=UPI00240E75B6|nr:hypothetical protein [Streptomyces sp. LX-29]WFB07887.1 hypothetical protein LRS74_13135 [Streptomyces sp. LX-29]